MIRYTIPLALALALTGCGAGLQQSAEEAVRQSLKDPESARFGTFYYNSDTERACLTVNAKNSMGGYTGDKQVQLQHEKDGWNWIGEEEIGEDECKRTWADYKNI